MGTPPCHLKPPPGARDDNVMSIDRAVMFFAGALALLGVVLGWQVSPYWYLLSAFVGLNLMQASITGFCPAAMLFKAFGLKRGAAFE
jgi:hypothetical protein